MPPVREFRTLPCVVPVALCALTLLSAASPAALDQGRKLFAGEVPLEARMVGHTRALPQQAVRCTNCHVPESAKSPSSASASTPESTQQFGPALGPAWLARPVARRGGPPSSYDAAKLCRLLREGIDPAHVMILQTMPRYTLTNAECEALWTFLTAPPP